MKKEKKHKNENIIDNKDVFSNEIDAKNRKLLNEELRQTKDYLENLIDYANAPIIVWDAAYKITRFNYAFEHFSGYKAIEVIGNPIDILFPESSLIDSLELIKETSAGEKLESVEIPILHKSGDIHIALWNSANIYSSDKKTIIATIAQGQDITDRKIIENTLLFLSQTGEHSKGIDFFTSLAKHLAETLKMDYVCIDRLLEGNLEAQTLAQYFDGDFKDNIVYTLKDTPCGDVVDKSICCFTDSVQHLFPKDEVLQEMNAESYIGTILWDSNSQKIGLIAIIGRKRITNPNLVKSILQLVSVSAANELERRKAEQSIRESEAKFRSLFTQMSEGFALHQLIYDSEYKAIDYKIIDINPAFETQIGISAEKAKNSMATQLYGVSEAPYLEIYANVAKTAEPYFFESYFSPLDKYFNISVFSPNSGYFATIFTDITERKRSEEQITKLSQAMEQSPVSIVITNLKGDIEYVNPKFSIITGFTYEEAIGNNPRILKSDETTSDEYKELWENITSGKEWRGEFHNKKKNGELYWEFASISPIKNNEGVITHFLAVKEDITERKKIDQSIKESEAQLKELNATKDKFFSIISHDLRSPFNSILGFSEILIDQIKRMDYKGIDEYAKIIQKSSFRALDLVTNLLEWSRLQTGRIDFNPEYFELHALIKETTELLVDSAQQKSINIFSESPRNIPVFADKAMISTVLRNIISNAIKFTNTNGKILISTEQKQNELLVTVSDNGIGIKKEILEKLFRIEETYSTKGTQNEQGTGLGLILCKEFIGKHGGKIWVKSEVGNGSKFIFSIPKFNN
ncbi:MAG: PAS domain S-box protein [Bacteroidetes bacterium]|nr:PAS domain S-box protein [Bacteroidota bacterium]